MKTFTTTLRLMLILVVLCAAPVFGQQQPATNGSFFHKIDPKHPVSAANARQKTREILALKEQEELVLMKSEKDNHGFRHEKYQLTYKGVPVEHGVVLIHYEKNGNMQVVNGERFVPSADINITPRLTESEAVQKAKAEIKSKGYSDKITTQLVIHKEKVVYRITISATNPISSDWIYIDAGSGEVLDRISQLMHATGTAETRYSGAQTINTTQVVGHHVLHDTSRGQGIFTYNLNHSTDDATAVDFTDNDNNWTAGEHNNATKDIGALDAHWGLEMSYDYWKTVHKRDSYDGQGSPITAYVHYDINNGNAFWHPVDHNIHFGDRTTGPWTELDVAAHELGHGVTHSFGLLYTGETGILHEGLSDIYAACVTNYVNGLGILPTLKNVWSWAEETNGNPSRNFSTPLTYWGYGWSSDLNGGGGFHGHAQVLRYWFYLLSNGGSGTNDHQYSYNVSAQGMSVAEKIIYNALFFLQPTASFPDLKKATLQAAQNLYSLNSVQYQATLEAWNATGVFDQLITNYCIPGNSNPSSAWISNFKVIKTLVNGGSKPNGYYFDPYVSLDIIPGINHPITATTSNATGINKYWKVWIDLNRDGVFNNVTEIVYEFSGTADNITGNLAIPMGTHYGNSRMRIGMSLSPISTPCDIVANGDFRDINVNFLSPSQVTTTDGYCIPFGTNADSEIISFIKMGPEETTGWYPSGGYARNGIPSNVWIGEPATLKIKPKFLSGAAYEEYFTAWIDFNQNKTFDADELIYQGHSSDSIQSSIIIPPSAALGTTIMRIAMSRGAYTLVPCMPVEFGEFLDFKLVVHPASELMSSDGYCTPRGSCASAGVTSPYNLTIKDILVGSVNLSSMNLSYGYYDFTSMHYSPYQFGVKAGQVYPLTLNAHNNGGYWIIWIDYNNNKAFEDAEIAFQSSTKATVTTQGALSIQPNAVIGSTRMRVLFSFFSPNTNPCAVMEYGQIMDLPVDVQSNPTPCPDPSGLTVSSTTYSTTKLTWTPGPSDDYEVQYRVSGNPFWTTVKTGGPSTIDLQNLVYATNYEVKVRGVCSASTVSNWISGQFMTATPSCGTPQNFTVANTQTTSVTVTWTDPINVGNYSIENRPTGSANWATTTVQNKLSHTISNLVPGSSYDIRIKRTCVNEDSDYSPVANFNTTCLPPQYLEVGGVFNSVATINWVDVNGPGKYLVNYAPLNSQNWASVSVSNTLSANLPGLIEGTTYQARVSRVCELGASSWSAMLYFYACSQPQNLAISNITFNSATASWTTGNGETYGIYYSIYGANYGTLTTGPTFQMLGLVESTQYDVEVQKDCGNGGSKRSKISFVTSCSPVVGLQISMINYTSATVSWGSSTGYGNYILQYRQSGMSQWNSVSLSNTSGLVSYPLQGLLAGKLYEVQVMKVCDLNESWSNIVSFSTLLCSTPQSLNVESVTSSSAYLTWVEPNPPLGNYALDYRIKGSSAWTSQIVSGGNGSVIPNLLPGTLYEVRVSRICNNISSYSSIVTFTTTCPVPQILSPSNVTSSSALISWTEQPQSVGDYIVYYRASGTSNWLTILVQGKLNYMITDLFHGTFYEAKVKRYCTNNGSVFSEVVYFSTLCPTPVGFVARDVTTSSVTFSWTEPNGASVGNYELRYRQVGSYWTIKSVLGQSSYQLSNLASGTTYEAYISQTCGPLGSPFSSNIFFTTYCTSRGQSTSGEYIDYVKLGSMTHQPTRDYTGDDGGYGLFPDLTPPVLYRAGTYTLSFSAYKQPLSLATEYWRAWIDFNQNGSFQDPGEQIMSTSSTATGTLTANFVVPAQAVLGNTMMRISMKRGATPLSCETFAYGEVEDYYVNIATSSGGTIARTRDTEEEMASQAEPSVEGEAISIYPNPVSDILTLSGAAIGGDISITDIFGREVFRGPSQQQIDVSNLPAGAYLLVVIKDRVKQTFRFLKL